MNRASLILDGDCGLCNRLAIFLSPRLREPRGISFLTNDSEEGRNIIQKLPINQQNADTVYLVINDVSYFRSAAAIRCLLYMRWNYRILYPFCWLIPLPIRDLVYIIISKNRHKIFLKPEICLIPSLNED